MTTEIINFADEMLKRYGAGFMLCPRCLEQTCFLPIVDKNKTGVFIAALQCVGPNCEEDGTFFPVVNGYVQEAE